MKSNLRILMTLSVVVAWLLAAQLAIAAGPNDQKPVQKQPAKQEQSIVDTAKVWVKAQWTRLQSYFDPATGKQQNVAVKPKLTVPAGARAPAQNAAAPVQAAQPIPSAPAPQALSARASSDDDRFVPEAITDIPKSSSGVPVYKLASTEEIPRLGIEREKRISSKHYSVGGSAGSALDSILTQAKETPELLTQKELQTLMSLIPRATGAQRVKMVAFQPRGPVNRKGFDAIQLLKRAENKFNPAKFTPLTADEYRFLSGLLLYQQGDKCAVAVGLFHSLAKSSKYEAEGNYYLAMCSKKLGLTTDFIERARRVVLTQDPHYLKKILSEVSPDLPYELIEPFGEALMKAAIAKKIPRPENDTIAGNIYYILANYGAQSGNFKLAQQFGKMVPEKHAKWAQSQFLLALGEYQTGSKSKALTLQNDLIAKLDEDKTKIEFQALVALNLARMYFQEQKFKEARDTFQKVYKDHPLWLQSLQEMGWSQLQSDDFEGAIGNMYSVQAPYFDGVYKPESYVIRTIGYLNICQYGDAYRTLTQLEKQYRPWLTKMTEFQKLSPDYLATVRKFLAQKSASAEIDGLPSQVIREMVRHRDFTNLQTSLNRQIDEQASYSALDNEVDKALTRSRWLVNNSRKRSETLRSKIASIKKNAALESERLVWQQELTNELELLNSYFFQIDLFNEAKSSLQTYKREVVAGAESRMAKMKSRVVGILSERMTRMRGDLARMLENNELLRYEVFSGSGENIRYQVAGGEKGNRVPAEVIPQSKSLTWDFAGEYWEDEIGHYRSSLKNNCPDTKHASL